MTVDLILLGIIYMSSLNQAWPLVSCAYGQP